MKKYLIVLILRILETHSDEKTPLTQTEITKLIDRRYPCDRKTVGRNMKFLKEIGYPIVKTPKGFYMDNKLFSRSEISFVLDLVRSADNAEIDRDGLCHRLHECLTRYYRH